MKRLSALLMLIMLLGSIFALPACAETTIQDGIEVTLTTDKESYTDRELIHASLMLKNMNDHPIKDVRMQILAPEGYALVNAGEIRIGELAAGAEHVLKTDIRIQKLEVPALPQTGDDSHGMMWGMLFVLSAAAVCVLVIRHPHAKRLVSLVLCVVLIAPYVMQPSPAYAAEDVRTKQVVVECVIAVDEAPVMLTGAVSYEQGVSKEMAAQPFAIVTQPKSQVVSEGDRAVFTIEATGSGLQYQWYYKKPGSSSWSKSSNTTDTYSFTMKESYDGRQIRCKLTDVTGATLTSDAAKLTLPVVAITRQPEDAWAYNGEKATVSVEATGDGLKYQWYYSTNGGKSYKTASSKNPSYSLTMSKDRDGRKVYCKVTDAYGNSVKSKVVTLNFIYRLSITTQPTDVKACNGDKVAVTVKAVGDGLKYAWYYKNVGMDSFVQSTIKKATCSVTMNDERNGRQMYCIVSDKYGNQVQSDTITMTMASPVQITAHPESQVVSAGDKATFTVAAEGDGVTYQWYYRNKGTTKWKTSSNKTDTYSFTMKESYDGRQVRCKVTDAYGKTATSKTAKATLPVVQIVTHPEDQAVVVGEKATFTVEATGDGLTYQWYYKKPGSKTWSKSSNKTDTYSFTMKESYDGRQIRCKVTDAYGNTVTSNAAKLSLGTEELVEFAYDTYNGKVTIMGYLGSAESVTVPAEIDGCPVTVIGDDAFAGNETLKHITLPDCIEVIGKRAFKGCTALTSMDTYTM